MEPVPDKQRSFSQLVVVGASAGGIEALSALVSTLRDDFPAPIVVAQHLSPHRASGLAEILDRRSGLPVRTVELREELEPGVIYVVPPGRDVTITDHEVSVRGDSTDSAGPHPSIDLLFRSAAAEYREDLIAVVLSGTGSDGAAGAREVKQLGGTVIIQNPETATFPGMPLSLAPSTVDIVANADAIGPLLYDLLTGAFTVPQQSEQDQFHTFLAQLREESGIDFSSYKAPTISRRLQRRMAATSSMTLQEYVRYLRQHPEERRRLVGSFLIKVTEFFRDPDLYHYLREQVLPELVTEAVQRKTELRLWSAGCATGEEAYSLAILVAEHFSQTGTNVPVRIFATDLDTDAVAYARRGIYPARALAALPPELIERYFTEHNGEYEVNKQIRSMLVFGEHDLGQRAPFPRIDLVLCRNVLIYFTPALQRRALQLFAFSLRNNGYLVLGKSETVSPLAEYFALDQSRLKIYRRIGARALIPHGPAIDSRSVVTPPMRQPDPQPQQRPAPVNRASGSALPRSRHASRMEAVMLGLPVGVVVVDRRYDVQSINSMARRLLGIHGNAVDQDLLHMLHQTPTQALRNAIDQALAGTTGELSLTVGEAATRSQRVLRVSAYPVRLNEDPDQTTVALTFIDVSEFEQIRETVETAEARARQLEQDNEDLIAANNHLTTTIARLHAENDELLVSAEEFQAATEEVETLNEELQASNEELETLNEELQATVEELNTTNDDLQARTIELQEMAIASQSARAHLETILASISDAVLVVDETGRVVLVNAAYERMFGGADQPLVPAGEDGTPLPEAESPQWRAARGETFTLSFTRIMPDGNRRWYEAESRPMPDDTARLGVITIRDITERSLRHLQDQWLAIAGHELRTPIAALLGHLQLTQRRARALPDASIPNRLDRALGQVQRISQLVDQLIDATRFQHGRISLAFEQINLVEVIDQVVETARMMPGEAEITFDRPAGPIEIMGDPGRLEQALSNLVLNAISHASGPVRVIITVQPVRDGVEIEVSDNGPGIPQEVLPVIFERFTQGSGVRAGLGLGLFICREIVIQHGGTISVDSAPDTGTTFTLSLPAEPPALSAG